MNKTKPFLKWAGNKFRCIETILHTFPSANRLVEPFTGSGAIFLNSNYPQYLLAETNGDLVNLFRYVQREGEEFIEYCAQFFTKEKNCPEVYYALREQFNQSTNRRRKSALFLYLNKHGYNGLCRYNLSGGYNVPFGQYVKPYFPRNEMRLFHEKSNYALFVKNDFRKTFAQAMPGDLIYCDPPYVALTKSANFSSYTHKKFTERDQIELAQLAFEAAGKGIPVIISNHDTESTRHYYRQSSRIVSFPVKRSISCLALKREPVQELVAVFNAR
ncbi:MAG: Dam family site-specific DNA-(adenine-N6)-methyltransferase [Tatlockia sp.]|jgi:DNA adenine methylase